MKIGRPKRNLEIDGNTTVVGLCPLGDGRWRITLPGPHKGKRFNESDPRLAVLRFQKIIGESPTVRFPVSSAPDSEFFGDEPPSSAAKFAASIDSEIDDAGNVTFVQNVDEAAMIEWARNFIISDKMNAAIKLGLPGIANIDITEKAITPLKLDTLLSTYVDHAPSNWRTKGQARSAVKRLKTITGAKTISDLETKTLIAFREKINEQLAPAGASQVFSKIKAVIGFGVKYGLDANQLGPALTRLKILYAPPTTSEAKPQPIDPEDFRKLLAGADTEWRAILLLSMNMSLYLEDICTLRWEDFNLVAGTYVGRRGKTQVVRIGWLWRETIDAIKALPRKGESPLLFTSQTGLRFNASSKYDTFASLRTRVGVTAPFSSIRDGSYSAAAAACDEKTAKLFAAHRFGGLMDSYVQRRPALVKAAAEAVYVIYGPFRTAISEAV